jgi:eukaryotic-like serine/threonine-protein kinase
MSQPTATGIYAQMDLAPGTLLAGRFRIEALLGVGGMGVVYRAHDIALDVPVAIKLLRPELATRPDSFERFRQELLLARQVSSPHVVRIHDLARHDGHWLISMDYVDGEGLDHRIDRGPLPLEDALRIARQVALGLQAAHARGVVHRDLKPANVLIDREGNAYISDFGVARSLASSGLTHAGMGGVVGTPDYLSPEQARGDPVDTRSDLYALGLILHEMLTGMPAFQSATAAEAIAQRLVGSPPAVTRERPDLPGWVARLVERLLRPQPAHRLPDAAAVIEAIDRRAMPHDFRPRRRAWLAMAALLALAGVGGTLWWTAHDKGAAIAAAPPLHRVLVLPLHGAAVPVPRLVALDAYLRASIFALPGVASVDTERTHQALRQLDAAGSDPDPATLRRLVVADRTLSSELRQREGHWYVHAELLEDRAPPQVLDGPPAADAVAAFRAWLAQPALGRALGTDTAVPELRLPAATATLDAFGAALQAREGDKFAAALDGLRAITKNERNDPVLWLVQLRLAQAIGERDIARDAIEQGQRAAHTAPARLQRVFAAEHALHDGDVPGAIAQWRAQLAQTSDDTLTDLQLARAQGSGGDFSAAIARLTLLTTRDSDDPRAWFELGKFSILQGEARRAVDDYLVRALVLYKRSRNLYGVAETVNALGIGYGRLGQTANAEEQYRKAVTLQREVGNRRGVATSLRNLANVLSLRGAFDEAGDELAQARALNAELDDREGLAAVDNELGVLAEERGDYRGALEAYRRALQGWQQAGDAHGLAQALNDIGFANYQLGHYDDAQSYWQRAAESDAGLGDTGRIRTGQNLGLLAAARGRWQEAGELQQRALAEAEKLQMPEETAVSRRNLAELALMQGDVAGSLAQADKAIALFRQREDQRGEADTRLLRVQALLAAGAGADAQRELTPLEAGDAGASREQRARVEIVRAELALHADHTREASAALDRAQPLADASGVRELQLRVALLRARIDPRADSGLDAATAALGNAELRLDWLTLAMQRALAAHDAAAALRAYREATSLMRGSEVLDATQIHTLGARAQRLAGDEPAATDAEHAATVALASFRGKLPADLRSATSASVQRVGTDETTP